MSPISVSRRYRLPAVWAAVVSLLIGCLVGTPNARAAAPLDITGLWNSLYHCTVGWCAGDDFPDPLTLQQGPGGVITGSAPATVITGTLSGHSLRMHAVEGSYTADYDVTVAADGLTWTGTASDNNGTQGDSTATRQAKPPTLSISIHPNVPSGGMAIGDVLSVPVTVSATGGDVSDVTLGTGLQLGGGVVAPSSPFPKLPTGFTLADGASRTFTYVIKAVKPGTATLTASVDGSWNSTTLHDDASKTIRTSNHQLKITVAPTPGTVDLEADDDGKVAAKFISVRVKLANAGKAGMTGRAAAVAATRCRSTRPSSSTSWPSRKGLLPVKIGTIEPGANLVKTLQAAGDRRRRHTSSTRSALYADASVPVQERQGVGRTPGSSRRRCRCSTSRRRAEGSGTVKRRRLVVRQRPRQEPELVPDPVPVPAAPDVVSGNAGGLGPHQIGVVPVDDPAPPLAGPLAPGKTISFLMSGAHRARTAPPAARSTSSRERASGDPGRQLQRPGHGQGQARIAAKLIKVAKDSESFDASVDITTPEPERCRCGRVLRQPTPRAPTRRSGKLFESVRRRWQRVRFGGRSWSQR